MDRFLGKFRGIVVDNEDPSGLARVTANVPAVLGLEASGWLLPCSPYAGPGCGLVAVPPIGSVIHVEWPAGDPAQPGIWSGGMWTEGDAVAGAGPDVVALVTPGGHRIEIRDTAGSEAIELSATSGATITMDGSGIVVSMGGQKIAMTATSVSINDGALTVT
jgi:uncharacterized protein involved in type VI secretion and phage assembly